MGNKGTSLGVSCGGKKDLFSYLICEVTITHPWGKTCTKTVLVARNQEHRADMCLITYGQT